MQTTNPSLTFAPETPGDIAAIDRLTVAAFGQPGEAGLVAALRQNGGLIFSAVAKSNGVVVAHAGFSPMTIGGATLTPPVLALAPVAVDPPYQRKGVGIALIQWSLDQLRDQGFPAVIVLGEPEFYGRAGFQPASDFNIRCPYDVPAQYFLALELEHGALRGQSGVVGYREEFAALG